MNSLNHFRKLLLIAGFCLLPGWCGAQTTIGASANNFSMKHLRTGETLNLTNFAGQIVVIDFWAYW